MAQADTKNTQDTEIEDSKQQLKIVPDLIDPNLKYHAFVAYADSDKQWVMDKVVNPLKEYGFKLMLAQNELTPGKTILQNIEENLDKSQRLVVVCSQEFVNSHWTQYEAIQGIQKMLHSGEQFVQVIKHNIDTNQMPKYLNWLTYIDSANKDFHNTLIRALSGETASFASEVAYKLEVPGIGKGMAWSYFYSYLNIILPGLKDRIEEYLTKPENENIKMAKRLFLLVPEDANCPLSIVGQDNKITIRDKENDKFSVVVERGGSRRPYWNTVLTMQDGEQTYQLLAEYTTVLLPLHEMGASDTDLVQVSEQERLIQVQSFYTELQSILKHPKYVHLGRMVELVRQEDKDKATPLSKILLERVKHDLLVHQFAQQQLN